MVGFYVILDGFGVDYNCDDDLFSWDWGNDKDSLIHHEGYYGVYGRIEGDDFEFDLKTVTIEVKIK